MHQPLLTSQLLVAPRRRRQWHPIPSFDLIRKVFLEVGIDMDTVLMTDICADAQKTKPEYPRVFEYERGAEFLDIVTQWLLKEGVLHQDYVTITIGMAAQEYGPACQYGAYHPSPLGAPLLARRYYLACAACRIKRWAPVA